MPNNEQYTCLSAGIKHSAAAQSKRAGRQVVNRRRTVTDNVLINFEDGPAWHVARADTYGVNGYWVLLRPIAVELDDDGAGASSSGGSGEGIGVGSGSSGGGGGGGGGGGSGSSGGKGGKGGRGRRDSSSDSEDEPITCTCYMHIDVERVCECTCVCVCATKSMRNGFLVSLRIPILMRIS